MSNLTFGEQVKIVLSRKGMTIKELAESIEVQTGKKMSRQNLTQRLGRDNFQEQDMRMIASILECPFELSILGTEKERERNEEPERESFPESAEQDVTGYSGTERDVAEYSETEQEDTGYSERGITVGEFLKIQEEMDETSSDELLKEVLAEMDAIERESKENEQEVRMHSEAAGTEKQKKSGWLSHFKFRHRENASENRKKDAPETESDMQEKNAEEQMEQEAGAARAEKGNLAYFGEQRGLVNPAGTERLEEELRREKSREESASDEEDVKLGEINPYTGREYASNSVRMHPKRIGYVQVYNRKDHKWTDMTEWAFLGYQERKKALLGKDYEPPIYLD